jgi:hypothetical protein
LNLLGLHYFPDSLHYRQKDLKRWLPILNELKVKFLLLKSPVHFAIPEPFIRDLIEAKIQPVIQLNKIIDNSEPIEDVKLLFSTYARWGVKSIVAFDRPNVASSWRTASWYQPELVERFLDIFIPIADLAIDSGLVPIFPPLQPGGDYWDLTFLRESLLSIKRRGLDKLLSKLSIAAYAFIPVDRSIHWGQGGPQRWLANQPYQIFQEKENHFGLYIFDWYSAISIAAIGENLPIYLFGIGQNSFSFTDRSYHAIEHQDRAKRIPAIIYSCFDASVNKLLDPEKPDEAEIKLDKNIQACFFYCLDEPPLPDDEAKPTGTEKLIDEKTMEAWQRIFKTRTGSPNPSWNNGKKESLLQTIDHYLLLPKNEWGISEWHYESIRPFVFQHQPTVGFSILEATNSAKVTVAGDPQAFTEEEIQHLINAGCIVQRLNPDGTTVATIKAKN